MELPRGVMCTTQYSVSMRDLAQCDGCGSQIGRVARGVAQSRCGARPHRVVSVRLWGGRLPEGLPGGLRAGQQRRRGGELPRRALPAAAWPRARLGRRRACATRCCGCRSAARVCAAHTVLSDMRRRPREAGVAAPVSGPPAPDPLLQGPFRPDSAAIRPQQRLHNAGQQGTSVRAGRAVKAVPSSELLVSQPFVFMVVACHSALCTEGSGTAQQATSYPGQPRRLRLTAYGRRCSSS